MNSNDTGKPTAPGGNLKAGRLPGHSPRGADHGATTNATLVNSMLVAPNGLAGFDSRVGGNHLLMALQPGYAVVDKGTTGPQAFGDEDIHYARSHLRPARIIELQRVK